MRRTRGEMFRTYLLLSLGGVLMAFPFYFMIITSFKPKAEVQQVTPTFFPHHWTVEPYQELARDGKVYQAAANSVIIAMLSTIGTMFVCTLAGYAFAKHRFAGRDFFFVVLLATMMIPGAVLLIPSFLLFRDLGWLDTWAPLIVPGLGGAFGVFLARQFISSIPDSLIESARLEGASELRIIFRIIFPLSKALLATLGILSFLGSWNSFLGPLIILLTESRYTLPLVVALLQGRFADRQNVEMAGAMVSIIPVLILFFFFQRQVVASLANTGLKE
ncbi:MAG TPA: carbohydrate ABC transporter permease [Fimbriimonas sp.]|nr:carbohydrate ABC transporter permease [Fimbriimonas sp.]